MNRRISIVCLFLTALFMTGCNNDKKNGMMRFDIEGTLTNAANKTLYIEEMTPDNGAQFVDSIFCDRNGHFTYKGHMDYATFFNLHTAEYDYIVLLPCDGEHIVVNGDASSFSESYRIEGSEGSQQMWQIQSYINDANMTIADLAKQEQYNRTNLSNDEYEQAHKKTDSIFVAEHQLVYMMFYNFIEDNMGSLSTLYAIDAPFNHTGRVFYAESDFPVFEQVLEGLTETIPDNPHTQFFRTRVERARSARMLSQQQQQPGQEIIIE